MEFQQNVNQNLAQTQNLTLSHAQMQGLQILAATNLELQTKLNETLQANPVLEVVKYGNEVQGGDPVEELTAAPERDLDREAAMVEHDENLNEAVGNSISEYPDYDLDSRNTQEDEEKRQHFFDSQTAEDSPLGSLYEQLDDATADNPKLNAVAQCVIVNLDDKGYLKATDEELASMGNYSAELVHEAVALVQSFEPAGIAARTLRECLLLQLDRMNSDGTLRQFGSLASLVRTIVDVYLEDVARNRRPHIAQALSTTVSKVNQAIEFIRQLDPCPGLRLSTRSANIIIPEAAIERGKDGGWIVRMNHDSYPRLCLVERYVQLANDQTTDSKARSYLKEMINSGNQFIRALEMRKSTIERITETIVELQPDFLEQGLAKLHPMMQRDIAERLELHETTISRAIAGKYLRTPHGVFEYKAFFSTGYTASDDGEELSSRAIRLKIRELIQTEDPHKPLSDQKIADLLVKDGLDVARRTVAKYREMEGIPATSLRKLHE